MLIGLTAGWLWGSPRTRATLMAAALVGIVALGFNWLISLFWFHPRPFMMHVGHTYLVHAPDSSFPSDHVTLMTAVGLVLVIRIETRIAGAIVLALAVLTAWARVYLGVHFPLDMAGAAAVATLALFAWRPLQHLSDRHLLSALECAYRRLLARAINYGWIKS